MLFSINLQEESLAASKYIKYIFSAISVLLSLTVFIIAPRSVPANFNAFTFIHDIYSQKHIFFIFSFYYFAVAVINVIYLYRLVKLPTYSRFVPIVIITVSIYHIYMFFIQFLYHEAEDKSIVFSSFFINFIPVISIFLSVRLLSTYGKNFNELRVKALKLSEEATCIVYNKAIKYANPKFLNLFFNNENFDISNPNVRELLPSDFFDDRVYNSKLFSFSASHKKEAVDFS